MITARRMLNVACSWRLTAANFILPIFVHEECRSAPTLRMNGTDGFQCSKGTEDIPISSMPDVSRVGVHSRDSRGGAGLGKVRTEAILRWTQDFSVKLKRHDVSLSSSAASVSFWTCLHNHVYATLF